MVVLGKRKTAQARRPDPPRLRARRDCFGAQRRGIENFRNHWNQWKNGCRGLRYCDRKCYEANLHSLDLPPPLEAG